MESQHFTFAAYTKHLGRQVSVKPSIKGGENPSISAPFPDLSLTSRVQTSDFRNMDQANAAMTADSRFSYHPLKTCEQTGASHTRSCIVLKDTQQMLSLSKQSSKAPGDTSLQDATSLTILGGAAQSSTRLLDHLGAFPPMLARTLPALATLCVVNAELTSSSLRPNNMRYLWHYSSLSELVFQKVCFATASQLLDMMSVVPSLSILRTQAVTASTTRGLSQERQLPGNIAGLRRIVVEDHHDDPVVNLITKVGNEATLSVLEVGVGGTVGDGKLWAPLVCLTSASLEEFCLRCVPGEMEPTVLQDVGKYCDEQTRGISIH